MDAPADSRTAVKAAVTPTQWVARNEHLLFKLGPFTLMRWPLRAAVLTVPFAQLPRSLPDSVEIDFTNCDVALIPEHPTDPSPPLIAVQDNTIRYISFTDIRYFVSMAGRFEDYLKSLSSKRRYNLLRRVRKCSEMSGGEVECRLFSSSEEMLEFQKLAVQISESSYKKKIGWTFHSSDEFGHELQAAAAEHKVRGYVLYSRNVPAAYAFCRIEGTTVEYSHVSYDPQFAEFSPGTVLLYMLLERLFQEQRFRLFDFMGGKYWPYKQEYSTDEVPTAIVWWFPNTLKNRLLVRSHFALRQFEETCVRAKKLILRQH